MGVFCLSACMEIDHATVTVVLVNKIIRLFQLPRPQLEGHTVSDNAETVFRLAQFPGDVQHAGNTEPLMLQCQLVDSPHTFEALLLNLGHNTHVDSIIVWCRTLCVLACPAHVVCVRGAAEAVLVWLGLCPEPKRGQRAPVLPCLYPCTPARIVTAP